MPQGNNKPVVLVKVLQSPIYIKCAAARKFSIGDLSDGDDEDSNDDSEAEAGSKGVVKNSKRRVVEEDKDVNHAEGSGSDEDGNDDSQEDTDEGEQGDSRKGVEMPSSSQRPKKKMPKSRAGVVITPDVPVAPHSRRHPMPPEATRTNAKEPGLNSEVSDIGEPPKKRAHVQKEGGAWKKNGPTARPAFAQKKGEKRKCET